jgi:molybdopterin-guanine dinucleotide biosynthesis protein A
MNTPTAAILAGGRSERMGRDKAELVYQGETLLARTARIAQEAGCRVLVVGREQPNDWPLSNTRFMPDAWPRQGPLGGLLTALQGTQGCVLALACDLPLLTPHALRWLLAQDRGPHGVTVQNGSMYEPLFSIYAPGVFPLAQTQIITGRRSLQALIQAGDFHRVLVPPAIAAALVNVNTPEDWERL